MDTAVNFSSLKNIKFTPDYKKQIFSIEYVTLNYTVTEDDYAFVTGEGNESNAVYINGILVGNVYALSSFGFPVNKGDKITTASMIRILKVFSY